jgi:hypothetical protein
LAESDSTTETATYKMIDLGSAVQLQHAKVEVGSSTEFDKTTQVPLQEECLPG